MLIAPFVALVLAKRRAWFAHGVLVALIVAPLGAVLVGNVTIQADADYRFPGPYVYGSDTRSLTPELLGLADWMRATQGAGQGVVADRDTSLVLASIGDEQTTEGSPTFPIWELYFSTARPSTRLVSELITSDWRYMVIDRRMSQHLPVGANYFESQLPPAGGTSPPSAAALSKYEYLPWVTKVYTSDNLEVYRFDFAEYRSAAGRPPVVAESPS